MTEILVKAVDATHHDSTIDRQSCYKKGDIVVVAPDGHLWGSGEGLPNFVRVNCPPLDIETARTLVGQWLITLDWEVVGRDLDIDGYRLRVWSTNSSPSGEGVVTKSQVEGFLKQWNATIVSVTSTDVVFDVQVFDAITSSGFWKREITFPERFSELSYTPDTGVHRISFNYGGLFSYLAVNNAVVERGGTVVADNDGTIVFDIPRTVVFNSFKVDLLFNTQTVYRRSRYYFTPSQVDFAIAQGGVVDLSLQQFTNNIHDRVVE